MFSWLESVVISQFVVVDGQNIKYVSPTLPNSVSRPWLHPPENHRLMDPHGLLHTLPSCPIL